MRFFNLVEVASICGAISSSFGMCHLPQGFVHALADTSLCIWGFEVGALMFLRPLNEGGSALQCSILQTLGVLVSRILFCVSSHSAQDSRTLGVQTEATKAMKAARCRGSLF